jgi:hypothetical protein
MIKRKTRGLEDWSVIFGYRNPFQITFMFAGLSLALLTADDRITPLFQAFDLMVIDHPGLWWVQSAWLWGTGVGFTVAFLGVLKPRPPIDSSVTSITALVLEYVGLVIAGVANLIFAVILTVYALEGGELFAGPIFAFTLGIACLMQAFRLFIWLRGQIKLREQLDQQEAYIYRHRGD